jgi:hypothetical protein
MTAPRILQWLTRLALYGGLVLLGCAVVIALIGGARSGTVGLKDALLPASLVVILAVPPLLWGWNQRRRPPGNIHVVGRAVPPSRQEWVRTPPGTWTVISERHDHRH